jgi:hypothetical protein
MEIVGERLGGALVFGFWCKYNTLYTIEAGSMRGFQSYRTPCTSIKTHRTTPKYGNEWERLGGPQVFEFW